MDISIHSSFLPQDDPEAALAFYRDTLGFEVRLDVGYEGMRWLTVGPPSQPDLELILMVPGPPQMPPEAAEQIKAMISNGALGSGVFGTDDCRGTYAELSAKGVEFLEEPAERFYGVEAMFRDNSGNWFSLTQRT